MVPEEGSRWASKRLNFQAFPARNFTSGNNSSNRLQSQARSARSRGKLGQASSLDGPPCGKLAGLDFDEAAVGVFLSALAERLPLDPSGRSRLVF